MSMFSFPADMNMNEMMKSMSAMTNWTKAEEMPVSPLMVYPLGAAAAATAIGFGIAGQMTGLMAGAMQAAMQSQGSALGSKPDLSWMFPVLAEDLAPEETEVAPAAAKADARPEAKAKSADIVELKPAAKVAKTEADAQAAPKTVKAKPARAKSDGIEPGKPKPAALAKAKPAAVAPDEGAVAVVEKLKSDANIAAAAASETAPSARAVEPAAKPALEPEDFRRPTEIEKPESPDDLKLISGVGPKLEQVLNGLGVWTFAQIADWKAEEIAWVDDYLQFKGRIDRDDWTSQARMLAEGGKTA
jgi:NADH-quinone oxidoreductase subunit E